MPKAQAAAQATPVSKPNQISHVADAQVDKVLELLKPIVEAVGRTVGPHCEVVLHDLRVAEHSIVAISNGNVTGRRVGGPVIGGPTKDVALKLLDSSLTESTLSIGYKTHTRDNRELRSTSLVLRTYEGKPVIALCLNLDLSAVTMARLLLEDISKAPSADAETPTEDAQTDVADVMAQMIQEALAEVGKPTKFMDRDERLHAVRLMHQRGLFLIRGGVERAAAALGISRFTLYSYLKEVRNA
ncbi:MAG: PAS domain-containing protein [bacterium]